MNRNLSSRNGRGDLGMFDFGLDGVFGGLGLGQTGVLKKPVLNILHDHDNALRSLMEEVVVVLGVAVELLVCHVSKLKEILGALDVVDVVAGSVENGKRTVDELGDVILVEKLLSALNHRGHLGCSAHGLLISTFDDLSLLEIGGDVLGVQANGNTQSRDDPGQEGKSTLNNRVGLGVGVEGNERGI